MRTDDTVREGAGRPGGIGREAAATAGGPCTRLRLLGSFRLDLDGAPAEVRPSARRLLAYIGLHRRATRAALAGILWPDVTDERAQGCLRTTLWRLGRGHRPLVAGERGSLSLAETVDVDTRAFARSVLRAPDLPACDAHDDELLRLLLPEAELLPGWDEDWLVFERERLRQLRLHALDSLAGRLSARGRHARALEAALASARSAPLRESAHRMVISVHLARDDPEAAARHYQAFRELLRERHGLLPSPSFSSVLSLEDSQGPLATMR